MQWNLLDSVAEHHLLHPLQPWLAGESSAGGRKSTVSKCHVVALLCCLSSRAPSACATSTTSCSLRAIVSPGQRGTVHGQTPTAHPQQRPSWTGSCPAEVWVVVQHLGRPAYSLCAAQSSGGQQAPQWLYVLAPAAALLIPCAGAVAGADGTLMA